MKTPLESKRQPAQCFHPGEFVKDEMEARGWNVTDLAIHMSVHGMPVSIAQDLIDCKIDVTPNIAFGLRRAFGTSADFWINVQKAFDAWERYVLPQDKPQTNRRLT
jgi:HTH-type transcriptional regulator / antitoxin HigA